MAAPTLETAVLKRFDDIMSLLVKKESSDGLAELYSKLEIAKLAFVALVEAEAELRGVVDESGK